MTIHAEADECCNTGSNVPVNLMNVPITCASQSGECGSQCASYFDVCGKDGNCRAH